MLSHIFTCYNGPQYTIFLHFCTRLTKLLKLLSIARKNNDLLLFRMRVSEVCCSRSQPFQILSLIMNYFLCVESVYLEMIYLSRKVVAYFNFAILYEYNTTLDSLSKLF